MTKDVSAARNVTSPTASGPDWESAPRGASAFTFSGRREIGGEEDARSPAGSASTSRGRGLVRVSRRP